MDVRAGQTRRVRPGEGLGTHVGQSGTRHLRVVGVADEHRRDARQHAQAAREVFLVLGDDHHRIDRQRMRVDRGHEDRVRTRIDRRHLAERPRAQRGPQTRIDQVFADFLFVERIDLGVAIAREIDRIVTVEIDHHRLQHALVTTMDGTDRARTGRGEYHARRLLVGKKDLTELHPVAHLNRHGRLHTVVVEADDGNTAHRTSVLDALHRGAGNGQVQAAFDSYHALLAQRLVRMDEAT